MPARRPSSCFSSGGSFLRMASRNNPETKKLTESHTTAYGAVRSWINPPAAGGPASCPAERVTSSFELPSMRYSRSTSARQVRLIGDVEEDGEDARGEA